MAFRRNVIANFVSQGVVTLASIVMMPVYLRYMGAEAYGLVGFFTAMNAWFALLDVGLTPTLSREVARYRGGAISIVTLRSLLRALECFFLAVGVLAATGIAGGSEFIAHHWLRAEQLAPATVSQAITLMGMAVPLRWMSGLYRGAVNGLERQVSLAVFTIAIALCRFMGVFVVFAVLGTEPAAFFGYQLAVAAVELIGLAAMCRWMLPAAPGGVTPRSAWVALRVALPMASNIALISVLWIAITQLDKFILSRILTLSDFGYFSLAVAVAGGVNMIGAPVAQAALPRMVRLAAEGKREEMILLYRRATQLACLIVLPAGVVLAAFAQPAIWVWTGNIIVAGKVAPLLSLYAIANTLLAINTLAYSLQYALGRLRYHLVGHALMLALLLPGLVWATSRWGALGAAMAWLAVVAIYFAAWLPLVHHKLIPGLYGTWLVRDIAPIASVATLAALAMRWAFAGQTTSMMATFLTIAATGLSVFVLSSLASSTLRSMILARR